MWIKENSGATFELHTYIRDSLLEDGITLPAEITNSMLEQNGVKQVVKIFPTYNKITQDITPLPPVLNNGVWEQNFTVYELDAETIAVNQAIADADAQAVIQAQELLNSLR